MFTDITPLGSGNLGEVNKDENGYIYTTSPSDPSVKYASHKWTTVTIPYAGMRRFGLSWMICYEDSDGVKHYPAGDSDRQPNTITSWWFVDPRDGHCFEGRHPYYFTASMVDAPTLDKNNVKWTPPTYPDDYSGVRLTTPPTTVVVYIQYGSGGTYGSGDKHIYNTRGDAIKYDQYGNFNGTNYYVDDSYCKIIYEYDYFVKIANDELRTFEMPDDTPVLYATDYPDMIWRVDGVTNSGMIYSPLIPGMQPVEIPMYVQPPRPMIHVYDSRDKQMSGNGYAILEPISCEVYHEENGTYEATFETYCDKYQKFSYLKKQAQVKIPIHYHGELINEEFRVRQVTRKMDSYGNYRITAIAQHRFYDLSRYLIQDCRPTALKGQAALDWLFSHGWYGSFSNDFTYSSDIVKTATAYFQNCNVISALLGVDQAFVNRWGGKLYRHGSYFSINTEMENCRKSGVIMYSYNMTEIEFEEDDSQLITILKAEDNFGNTYTITNPDVPTQAIPHHIYGYVRFSYDAENIQQFHADAQAYFDEHKQSKINITVRFANLSDLEKYKQYIDLDSFEVGDKITVYHSDLDIYYSNLEIISKRFDAVAQKTMEIQIGSFKGAITRRTFMSETVSSGDTPADKEIIAINTQLNDMTLRTLRTWGGAGAYKWGDVAKYTWEDVTKYVYNND